MDYLTVLSPEGERSRYDLAAGAIRIGRSSGSDLVLQDLNVSRVHAEVVRRPEGYYVLDAGGKNGTFLNDGRIDQPTLLHPGDRIRVGTTTLVFNGAPTSPVEFSDAPLQPGPGTTYLAPEGLRTPALAGLPLFLAADGTPVPRSGPGVRVITTPAQTAADAALKIIFEADKELVFHRPLDEILETIMDLAGRAVRFERGLLMLLENGTLEPRVVRVPQDEVGRPISISRTIADRVMKNQESVLTSDALFDDRFKAGVSVEMQHIRSLMCVPLWDNRVVIGLIYVDSRQRAGLFTEENLRILAHLANVAAIKIENARLFEQAVAAERMEQELQKAAEIQNHLLPGEGPPIPGYALFGNSLPCREVGGDYYDYIQLPGGRYGIGLGDVAGKGLPAALLMCSFQASLRALSELDLPVEETIGRLNRLLCRSIPENRFVTFFYGILDPQSHVLSYVNAGQNPPAVVRATGEAVRLSQTGPPLGLFEQSAYSAETVPIASGEILVCYSDGVTEAWSPAEEEFGEDRLLEQVRQSSDRAPGEIVRRVGIALDGHCEGSTRQDDVTLVVLKREGGS